MATCNDCIHGEICDIPIITDGRKNASNCGKFKNKADVAEVKHGYWKEVIQENIMLTLCSVCGRRILKGIYNIEFYSDYCPHCGALMDGKDGDTK